MKNKIAEKIAYMLPTRIMMWAIIRAFSYTTTHECANKSPDETGYTDIYLSWEKLLGSKL